MNYKSHNVAYTLQVKAYRCDVCSVAYKSKTQLEAHMSKHTGVKKFTCPICSLGVNYHHHMKRHLATHRGINVEETMAEINRRNAEIRKQKRNAALREEVAKNIGKERNRNQGSGEDEGQSVWNNRQRNCEGNICHC